MQLDLSKVPNLEAREEVGALFQASVDATNAYEDAWSGEHDEIDLKYRKLESEADAAYEAKIAPFRHEHHARCQEIERQKNAEIGLTDLAAKRDAATDAYNAHDLTVETNWQDEMLVCALSGLPILEGDETLKDPETNDLVLRCLVLPPRPVEEEETEEAA